MPTTQEIKTIQQQMIEVLLYPTPTARLLELHAEWIHVLTTLLAQSLLAPELSAVAQCRAYLLSVQERLLGPDSPALLTAADRQQYAYMLGKAVQLL
ncbi:hypothetical protein [Hymenobacter yonginensis]|uniref:Uncharacterized protein n=1 Tax=Hymenobacter yonginensis TaxID=748197 RepID=A0ABY7PTV0_9BACT|nr:hypothetical protein [Hymenobacter yonginensis]WBO85984.1 hypothetical protein O9Z63_06955 [Hymenobacter yonginensis]